MNSAHPLTADQIADLRAGVRGLATKLDISLEDAWLTMFTPDYVWAAMADARDAVGRDERDRMDLLAADTPERQAAADACYAAIKADVLAD